MLLTLRCTHHSALTHASAAFFKAVRSKLRFYSVTDLFGAARRHPAPQLRVTTVVVLVFSMLFTHGAKAADSPIDINVVSAKVLADKLPGIGPVKAEAIVAYRSQHGPFTNLSSLTQVKGIGPRTLEKIKPLLSISAVNAASSKQPENKATSETSDSRGLVKREIKGGEDATTRRVRAVVNAARQQLSDESIGQQ